LSASREGRSRSRKACREGFVTLPRNRVAVTPGLIRVRLNVNREIHEIEVPAGVTLLGALRDDLGLTGTRYGCGHGECGACVVLADGIAVPSCMLTVKDAVGKRIVTIEGLTRNGALHPVQHAFLEEDALQCGYCTSGMVLSTVALLERTPRPTDEQIRDALAPHLCRCGVYARVLRAVKKAAR
jgi:nicotinate dehydrogenase subunit A